jgi:hypothetical protein
MPPIWLGTVNNNWNNAGNWTTDQSGSSGVPTATTDAIFGSTSSVACTVTPAAVCRSLNFNSGSGYSGTITFSNFITASLTNAIATGGDITFSSAPGFTMNGPGGILHQVNNSPITRTITTNGTVFNLPYTHTGAGGTIINLVGNFQVSNFTGNNFSITGNELRVSGNWSSLALGSANKVLNGTGTMAISSSATNLIISASGATRTFLGSITVTGIFTYISGTLVTTGTTFNTSCTNYDLKGQTFNNMIMSFGASTTVVASDIVLTGNLQLPNGTPAFNGPGKIFVSGNLTNNGTSAGTCVVEMKGSGSITGIIPIPVIINTALTASLGASTTLTNITCASGSLNLNNNFNIGSQFAGVPSRLSIIPGFNFTGSSPLRITGNIVSITSSGVPFPNSMEIVPTINTATVTTLNDNLTVSGSFSSLVGGSSNTQTLNGSTLNVFGNLTTTKQLLGTTNIILTGSTSINWSGAGSLQNNVTINKSSGATVTLTSDITWGAANRSLIVTAGTINPVATTFSIPAASSVTIDGMTFWNLTIPGASTTTHNISNTIQSNLTLAATGNTVFTGSAGWTCANLLCSTANRTITLANSSSGASYRTTTNANLLGTAAQRITMTSDNATTRSLWTLDNGATQSLTYVNGTRIDSSQGATVWSFGGLLTNTVNWGSGSAPQTVGYTFVC